MCLADGARAIVFRQGVGAWCRIRPAVTDPLKHLDSLPSATRTQSVADRGGSPACLAPRIQHQEGQVVDDNWQTSSCQFPPGKRLRRKELASVDGGPEWVIMMDRSGWWVRICETTSARLTWTSRVAVCAVACRPRWEEPSRPAPSAARSSSLGTPCGGQRESSWPTRLAPS